MLKNLNLKKFSSLIMASLFIVTTACSANNKQAVVQTVNPQTTAATTSEGATTTSNEPVKLLVGLQQNPNVENYDTNYLTLKTETDNNVDLSFMLLPTGRDDARTKFALMVTSNSQLPDTLILNLEEIQIYDYAKKGIFQNVTSYYDNPEIASNINKFPKEDKEFIMKNLEQPDSNIYSLFNFAQFQWNEGCFRSWINKDWTTKLNIPYPKTTDEFTQTLKDFVEKDPNGNGKKDEIGMIGSGTNTGWAQLPIPFLMNAFTYANPDKKYRHVENGKVYASYTKPEWKDGLEYMNKLVKDGLLSPLSFTQTPEQLKAIATSEVAIAGVIPAGSFSTFNNEGPAAERMDLLAPLTGPKGVSFAPQNPSLPTATWFITKDCKNPEVAFKVGDYFMSDEMSLTVQSGEKGVNWTDDPSILTKWAGKYFDEPRYVVYPEINPWGKPGNVIWQDGPKFERWEFRKYQPYVEKERLATYKIGNWNKIHLETYIPKFPKEVIGRLVFTEEEMEKLTTLESAIWEYVQTATVEFVTGNRPISDYDNFLKELDKMGLQEYIDLSQKGYDRSK